MCDMPDIKWGVSTSAYQIEGGINGEGEPANNWFEWDRSGRVEKCGDGLRFWTRPGELLDLTTALGCDAFRLSLEWARIEPERASWNGAAVARYAEIIGDCHTRGLTPYVTLHHFTHPRWLGADFWLTDQAPGMFASYATRLIGDINMILVEHGHEPVEWMLTINEPAILALGTYLFGAYPGHGRSTRLVAKAYFHMLTAHILLYDALHDLYRRNGWRAPRVSLNSSCATIAGLDALMADLMLARERGVERDDLTAYLAMCHQHARVRIAAAYSSSPLARAADAIFDRWVRLKVIKPDRMLVDALYASDTSRKLDFLAADYYDPVLSHMLMPAKASVRRQRRLWYLAEPWEQVVSHDGLRAFLTQAHLQAPDRPIIIAENGLCTPDTVARPDALRRDAFVRQACEVIRSAHSDGVPIAAYLHWTIADNYEWGSYRPRFGLHGVDRQGEVMVKATDATGLDAAGAYRDEIARHRTLKDEVAS